MSNNNQPTDQGKEKKATAVAAAAAQQNTVTNEQRKEKKAQDVQNQNEVVNPYVKNNTTQPVRTATVFKNKNKTAGNPFADGDGGDDTNTDTSNTTQTLDKTKLDPHIRFLLRHYLDLANPVYEQEEQKITLKRRGGNTEEVTRKRPVFKGYQFYSVDGESFNEWVHKNIGPEYEVDKMTKQITKKAGNVTDTKTS